MTFESDIPYDSRRSELKREFDYGNRILRIYDLEDKKRELQHKIDDVEKELTAARSYVPQEIIDLYEQMRVVDKLKGTHE